MPVGVMHDAVLAELGEQCVRIRSLLARRAVEVVRAWMLEAGTEVLPALAALPPLTGLLDAVRWLPPDLVWPPAPGAGVRDGRGVWLVDLNLYLGLPADDRGPLAVLTSVERPRVEVVEVRDPEYDTEVTVFVDGWQLSSGEYTTFDVDAGRGYSYREWMAERDELVARTSGETADFLAEVFDDPPGTEYITGAPEGWPRR